MIYDRKRRVKYNSFDGATKNKFNGICKECGKSYSGYGKTYCSLECSKKDASNFHPKGEFNKNWKGGISFFPYPIDWKNSLKQSIRERDHFSCRLCGINQSQEEKLLSIHHIDYNKQNCNPINLITLCNSCHSKTNHNREEWTIYFNNLIL